MKITAFCLSYAVLLAGYSTSALDMPVEYNGGQRVICSQGPFTCAIKDIHPLSGGVEFGAEAVEDLAVHAVLSCRENEGCSPCLRVNIQLNSSIGEVEESDDEGGSGAQDQEDDSESNGRLMSLMVCYTPEAIVETCKKMEFKVTPATTLGTSQSKLSLLLCDSVRVYFSSEVNVNIGSLSCTVKVPSLDEVCSHNLRGFVEECGVPRLSADIDQVRNEVVLRVEGQGNKSFPPLKMCQLQEKNGTCKNWTEKAIPLHSVTPCMCFQMWWDQEIHRSRRSVSCPFRNNTELGNKYTGPTPLPELFQRNVWENVSVSVIQGQMNSGGPMLSWNVSAPCRLEAKVWLCQRDAGLVEGGCRKLKSFRMSLPSGVWKQNNKGHWQVQGVFEDIKPHKDLCIMVQGMDTTIGPFCLDNTSRWRNSLLALVIVVLISLVILGFYFLRYTVKRWTLKALHKELRARRRGYVVLLSPPDAEGSVSEQVCELGSLLQAQGFSVCVDLWSRAQQCSFGPLPWLHSQLHLLHNEGGRVLVVLNRSAWVKALEWGQDPRQHGHRAHNEDSQVGEGEMDMGLVQGLSPYADVFSACLSCIQADYQQGRAGERFNLVTFESHPARPANGSKGGLPELLQGLPWFHLPSQRQGLLSALTEKGGGERWRWRWRWTEGLKGRLFAGLQGLRRDSQRVLSQQLYVVPEVKCQETEPLQHLHSAKSP